MCSAHLCIVRGSVVCLPSADSAADRVLRLHIFSALRFSNDESLTRKMHFSASGTCLVAAVSLGSQRHGDARDFSRLSKTFSGNGLETTKLCRAIGALHTAQPVPIRLASSTCVGTIHN